MLRLLVSTRFHILFHSPARGSFHLSFAVLVRYRSRAVLSLTGWSRLIHARFHVPRTTWDAPRVIAVFAYRTITVYGASFQTLQLTSINLTLESRYPVETFVPMVWAIPLSLAATKGVTVLFYFLPGTKMFQFPGLPHSTLFYSGRCRRHYSTGLPHSDTHGS